MSSSDGDGGPKLPHDVAVEILKRLLKRLPARSLLQFRCVCRSWRSTIDDPRFVALHSNHSALDPSNRYLVCLDFGDDLDPVQNTCSLFSNGSLTLPFQSQIEIPFVTPHPNCYAVVGSCDGLICVSEISSNGYGQMMYVWNLFTRKHRAVRLPGPKQQNLSMEGARVVQGFYFDAKSNDYNVVSIFLFPDLHPFCLRNGKPRVEIYSLGTDSWRTLECEVPAIRLGKRAVFLNGNLHWYATNRKRLGFGSIASFDVTGEVFDEMVLPEEMLDDLDIDSTHLEFSVAVLNDLLAVFISVGKEAAHSDLNSVCSVWVMRDYGVPESWTKLYTFEVSGQALAFDGFPWNGELLIDINFEKRVSWNPITGQFSNLPLLANSELVPVVESLFSL
ncbi:hypothetical protein BT93_I0022 [Corymbia citriodora subsp. variegata]|nr:hypothetical protein BT93_I0022 [Corymbia citriodora subsp. variegata]